MPFNFQFKLIYILLIFIQTLSLDLHGQCEELKGLLRGNHLLLKDQEFKFTKTVENYENQITRLNDENKQIKEKYEK